MFALTLAALAQAPSTKNFNVPANSATNAIKVFSGQSGVEVLMPTEAVKGVRTNAVQGAMSPRDALEKMVAGTGLEVIQDEKTGALGLRAASAVAKNDDSREASIPATKVERTATGAIKLETVAVLGTRIRNVDAAGPSPISTYNSDYIRSTGAMTVADFLSRLPQNYSGISAGRGSTPNELNPEFGSRSETITPPVNIATGISSVPANATGQSGVGLRGLGAGSTLVLVDGRRVAQSSVGNAGTDSRQGFVDLNTIPLGMVERIELVTDGTSAVYGADAVAGVINIVLKKNWSGSELSGTYKGAFDGGGHERSMSFVHGFSYGPLHGTLGLDYYQRADLKANQRPFSTQQDHSGIVEGVDPATGAVVFGTNFLLNFGYPATVQARTGNLTGITVNGSPTRVALTPEGLSASPTTTAGFVGVAPIGAATTATASGARRGNTSGFLDLIPPSERTGVTLGLSYTLPHAMEAYGRYTHSKIKGTYSGQPAVFTSSATTGFGAFATIVPAAYNPFAQDVLVGMIAYEFGSVVQKTTTKAQNALLGLKGKAGETWQWDVSAGWQEQVFSRVTREFNGAAVTAALANPDAASRFNPFVDARVAGAPNQKAIFEGMARYITFDGVSQLRTADLVVDGGLFNLPGGLVKMAAGLAYEYVENSGVTLTPSVAVVPVVATVTTGGSRKTYSVFSELSVPLFGKPNARTLLNRLDLNVAARYEDRSDVGDVLVPKVGLSWVPTKAVLLRAGYSEGFRAPSLTEFQQIAGPTFTNNTVVDPRRGNTVTTGVVVTRPASTTLQPETSTTEFYGLVFEPPQMKGLSFQINYYRTQQENVIQILTEQQLVNNEASFPGRVTRAAPDATDLSLNQPGKVIGVDRSLLNFGTVSNETVDFVADYSLPWVKFGRWRVGANASHTLKSVREVSPGVPAVDDLGDTLSPPEWRMGGSVFWSKGPFNGSLFYSYLSSFGSNKAGHNRAPLAIPSQQVIDLRVGYEFQKGVWGKYGRGSKVSLGIGNLLDEQPPFSDTTFGYNGALHSPLGRTYQVSLSCPF